MSLYIHVHSCHCTFTFILAMYNCLVEVLGSKRCYPCTCAMPSLVHPRCSIALFPGNWAAHSLTVQHITSHPHYQVHVLLSLLNGAAGNCGYGDLTKTPMGSNIAAAPPVVFANGLGCGQCYQVSMNPLLLFHPSPVIAQGCDQLLFPVQMQLFSSSCSA